MFCVIIIQFLHKICLIYVNYIQYAHLITVETIIWLQFYVLSESFLYERNMCFILLYVYVFYVWKHDSALLLSHSLVNINTANIDMVVSILFSQCRSNVDEHTLTQFWFSNKYQRWKNVEERSESILLRRWSTVDAFADIVIIE